MDVKHAESIRDAAVWQQTRSLLYKNLLIKWRTKQQSLQEVLLPLLLLALLIVISIQNPHVSSPGVPTEELDSYFSAFTSLGYTPVTNLTSRIMDEVAREMHLADGLEMFSSEEELENASAHEQSTFVGVVFADAAATAYSIRFPYTRVPRPNDFTETISECLGGAGNCRAADYWHSGFVRLQTLIDAAIIQVQSKRAVWSELDVTAVMMGHAGWVEEHKFPHVLISIYMVLAFTPFISFLILNVAAEKERRIKDVMTMMGLCDSAFWMSWGLLYAVLVSAMSVLMAVIATSTALFPNSNFLIIFLLIFLYGISSIFYSFALTPLFTKPKFASTVGTMLTVLLGCLSLFTILMEDFPPELVWILCLLSPAAFAIGVSQVVYLEAHAEGAVFSSLASGPHPLSVPLFMLFLDCILYLVLGLYLDQVLPGNFGMRRSLLYFLKPSYWSKRSKRYVELSSPCDGEANGAAAAAPCPSEEPVSPEFRGQEAIRITNISKVYHNKDSDVEALRGLTLDIYEGQITALLGHSGSGKSTLINILCGICPPSAGSAAVYGRPLDGIADMKRLVGICPQFDILFDVLTVHEHLRIFAAIKGIPPTNVDVEVSKVLHDLDLEKIMTAQAKNLSAGQKRKLAVGIAILGDPKILLLDEPTAGMDPCSRHQVWSLLKRRRAGRALVLSTHYMDEADILADRKAVISQGRLKCVGSSLYLKTKCGVGYHLGMSVGERCDADEISSLVRRHLPNARLTRRQEAELKFTLPFESVHAFAGLFSELDSRSDLGLVNYGVSMTTLEDVFLRLEDEEAEADQVDFSVFNREVERDGAAGGDDDDDDDETDRRLLMLCDKSELARGGALWRQQLSWVARLHLLNLWRERKAIVYVLCLVLLFLASMLVLSLSVGNTLTPPSMRRFQPAVYLQGRHQPPHRYASPLLVCNSTGTDISDFIRNLEAQDIAVEVREVSDYMAAAPHSAAINVTGSSKGFRYKLAFNSTTVHSLPITVNILSNALLRGLNSSARIQTWAKPFNYEMSYAAAYMLGFVESVLLGMLVAGMPAYFAMEHLRDRELRCRSTLRTSGLLPSAYWCGRALVDVSSCYVIVTCMLVILFSFHPASNLGAVVGCAIGFAPAVILFTYVCSFAFSGVQSNRDFFSVICMMVCVVSASLVHLPLSSNDQKFSEWLHGILCIFNPLYPLMGCLNCISKVAFLPANKYDHESVWNGLLVAVFAPYLQCLVLMFALGWLERRHGGTINRTDSLCRLSPARRPKVERNPDEGPDQDEDEDVQMERAKVKEALVCQSCDEKPLLVASNLRKQFNKSGVEGFALSKDGKVATKNVSFCVRKGEVLGLLGPNGSGKSTIMHMLCGEAEPTAGQVVTGAEQVGYCPQVNPLWPRITLREHLQIYAAVKGLKARDVPAIIQRVVNALELKEHVHKQARSLSPGLKRKLCFALSMIGNPETILLDEPSAGMDPKSKQRVWRAIRVAVSERERGAVLTTHYMEEAEAVCDRVAIVTSGRLRCLGSIQHLKAKFGRGYSLELKLAEDLTGGLQQVAPLLHEEIVAIFPHASRQESFATLMSYKIPTEDVHCLAAAFSQLERVKQTFKVEEYNFSQSTLEQVFLEFAKEQQSEDEEAGSLSTTFQWRRLTNKQSLADRPLCDSRGDDSVVQQL
ncbi:cholesterol transporter ABCA5 [Festucalex cinctus]